MTADEDRAEEATGRADRHSWPSSKSSFTSAQDHAMKEIIGLPIIDAFCAEEDRPDLAAQADDQLQLPRRGPLRSLHELPSGDRQDGARLGHRARLSRSSTPSSLTMDTPAERPRRPGGSSRRRRSEREELYVRLLKEVYGLQLADEGLLDPADAMVSVVRPQSLAAKARLEVGDVIESVDDAKILEQAAWSTTICSKASQWGQPLKRDGAPRTAQSLCQPSAARSVRRLAQPAQDAGHRLHDLPRRAGQRHGVQMGLARAERSVRRPTSGSASMVGSTTITGSFRCIPSASPKACA